MKLNEHIRASVIIDYKLNNTEVEEREEEREEKRAISL